MASSFVCGIFEKLKKCLKPYRHPLEVDSYSHEFLPPSVSLEAAASPRPCILSLYREPLPMPVQQTRESAERSFERACAGRPSDAGTWKGAPACFHTEVLPPTPSTSSGSSSDRGPDGDSLAEPVEDTVRHGCVAMDLEEKEEHAFHGNGE
jgi:hypothetical protein